ncbi:MmyB family transcriptional regulator [Actinoplanes sp. RD1]|uniref:MmyB family transcriptional regulator n=1 Tax=Actinoplanes sp. RD1 TaxID=3064538 RepID=UPI002741DDE4|nr:hypothetical protein [Actinoplanes sp. RD1]
MDPLGAEEDLARRVAAELGQELGSRAQQRPGRCRHVEHGVGVPWPVASPRFRDLWHRHDVSSQRGTPVEFDHPQIGEIALLRERLAISGTDGMTLTVYVAGPGSAAAEKLTLLASSALAAADGNGPDRSPVRRSERTRKP